LAHTFFVLGLWSLQVRFKNNGVQPLGMQLDGYFIIHQKYGEAFKREKFLETN
jgi:hypothetical protein